MGYINLKIEDHVAVLSIDRPKALNALSRELVDEIDQYLTELSANKDVRCLVIYSEKNFAAGADIKSMVECDEKGARSFAFSPTFNKIADMEIPTIALIEGYALGGGLELALACDIRMATENAKMGFPEIDLGIMPGAGGTIRAPKLIGEARTKELIFSGNIISAERAEHIGLINSVVPDDELLETGMKFAKKLAGKAPIAIWTAKKTIQTGLLQNETKKSIEIEANNWAKLFNTKDQKEGMRAFVEKRKPVYKGE